MPLRRSAATKVMVFQWPCGTRPISLSPRGQRPLSRTIVVLAAVSSTKTRWAGSNMPCSRIQRWRARATSARSCSAACRLFFESDVVMLEEAPHRAAAARNLVPVHRQNRLVQGQVWPSRNQTQQKIYMLLQRRDAPAPRLSRTAARLPKALDPDNRRAGTDIKLLGRRAPRRPAFNFRNHSRPHVFRIGLRHRPASQNRINADRLSHPSPSENLLDSIGTEHALERRLQNPTAERIVKDTAIIVAFRDSYLHAEVATPKARWKNPPPLAEFRRKLSRRYSLFDVGMACIRVWMELYEVCMSSIEQADRRAEGERRAAPDGTRKKAGRSSGRQKKAG